MRLGIAGYGRIVELVHYPIVKKMKEWELTAVFDVTPERLQQAKNRGLMVYDDITNFMENAPVDVVLIAAPTQYHYSIAIKGLECGKHLMIEKPIGVSFKEAMAIESLAKKMKKVVTVFHSRRFDSDFLFVKGMLESGRLGNISFIERSHHMNGAGVDFGIKSYNPKWRISEQQGGGVLLDWGIHLVDQLINLDLGTVKSIEGSVYRMNWHDGDADDYVNAIIVFENRRLASININSVSNANKPTWIVGGDKATLQIQKEEAFIFARGSSPERMTIPKSSRFTAEIIYQSFLEEINGNGKCAIQLEEAVQAMSWLDRIGQTS